MNGEKVMSYAAGAERKSKLNSLPIASRLSTTLRRTSASDAKTTATVTIWMMTDRVS